MKLLVRGRFGIWTDETPMRSHGLRMVPAATVTLSGTFTLKR